MLRSKLYKDKRVWFAIAFGLHLETDVLEDRSVMATALHGNIVVEIVGSWEGRIAAISRDSGASFIQVTGTESANENKFISFHPQNPNIVYAGKYKFANIQNSNTFTTLNKNVAAIFKGNGNIVYAFDSSSIYKSTDGGLQWTTPYPSLNLPSGSAIGQIAVDPTNENRIYAAVRKYPLRLVV